MSLKDKRTARNEPLRMARAFERKKLMRLLNNRYSYEINNPEGTEEYKTAYKLPFRYLERVISQNGRAGVYKDKNLGMGIYKAVTNGQYDIYGQPTRYLLYTLNGQNIKTVNADDKNLIIIKDTFNSEPYAAVVDNYARLLGKIRETIETNVAAMRTPYLIQTDKDNVLSVKLALEAINNSPEVIVDKSAGLEESIKVVDLSTPDNLESLEVEYHNVLSRFLEEIGFSSVLITKKERLVSAEADANGSTLIAFDSESYEYRLDFVEQMKKRFKIDLTLIKANNDIYRDFSATTEARPKVDPDSEIHNEPQKPINKPKPTEGDK